MKKAVVLSLIILMLWAGAQPAQAAPEVLPLPQITIGAGGEGTPLEYVDALKILALLTVLSLAPAILVLMTSFTRIVVVLSFVRSALATQQTPPNQVLIGLALFLTFFTMAPVFSQVNQEAIQPYIRGEITQQEALQIGGEPVKEFMLKQTRVKDLALFVKIGKVERPARMEDTPFHVLIPAFVISELKTAFEMGFLIYIPFIIIDMVVASILMSMGMFMLPPVIISLPFKLLLFVMVDGWHLVVKSLIESFN